LALQCGFYQLWPELAEEPWNFHGT